MTQKFTNIHGTFRALRRHVEVVVSAVLIVIIFAGPVDAASTWNPTALVNTEAFQSIDDTDSTANIVLKFGETLSKTLTYNRILTRFEFNDALYATGDIGASGTLSGAYVRAQKLLTSSGSVAVESGAYIGGDLRFGNTLSHVLKVQETTAATGKNLTVSAGDAATIGGELILQGGANADNRSKITIGGSGDDSGNISIDAGDSGAGSAGGDITISAGDGIVTDAGTVEISGGSNGFFGDGGSVYIHGGAKVTDYVDGDTLLAITPGGTPLGKVGIRTLNPSVELEVAGTISGSTVYGKNSLRSSGSLVFEGAASGSSLYLGTSLQGAGLSSCSNTTNDKLLYNSTTGRFSCGTDQSGGGPGGGMSQTAADERYVKKQGDTMTGALTLNITTAQSTSGALTILQRSHSTGAFIDSDTDREAAVAIDAAGTSVAPHLLFGYQGTFDTNLFRSGANTLKTNDALEVDGNLTFGDAISDAITVNASTWTFANDTNFALSGGVNGLSFDTDTLSVDALNNRIGINTTAPKTRLEVVGTISGSLIRASNMTVSGAIVYSSGNTLMQNAKGQSGQLLIAQGTNAPQWKDPGGGMIWYFDGTQAVTTMKGPQITMPMALTLSGISLKAKGAPTGAALIYDINKDGVSIFSTRPQIDAAAITGGSNAVFSTTVLPADSVLTIDIDQVGSTFAGSGVTIILKGIRRY